MCNFPSEVSDRGLLHHIFLFDTCGIYHYNFLVTKQIATVNINLEQEVIVTIVDGNHRDLSYVAFKCHCMVLLALGSSVTSLAMHERCV
jgi:hypothetical protein